MIEPSIRLRRAIHLNDVPLVRRIIKANPKLLSNPDYETKSNTSLHLASLGGSVRMVSLLLDLGHDEIEISRNSDWSTPLMLACQHGHIETGMLLIDRCARSIPWTNKDGLDVLAIACQHPASTALISPLLENKSFPADPHSRDRNGNTALHHASASGSLKALRILLSAGADPAAKNAYDWMPLAYSQTVAAEVYFKNLVAEYERRKAEDAREEKVRKEEQAKRKGAGVRLIPTGDDGDGSRNDGGVTRATPDAWSPTQTKDATSGLRRSPGRLGGYEGSKKRASK